MIKTVKRTSAVICAVLLMLCASVCVFAESEQKLTDDAYLFSSEEQAELTQQLESVSEETGWDVIIYTNLNDVDSEEMENYCNMYYTDHGYGKGSKNSGVFLTVDMSSREMYIITKGDAMYYFSDERVDEILDDVSYKLHYDDYYDAAESFISYTQQYYTEGEPEDGDFSNVKLQEKEDNPLLYVLKYYGIIIGFVALAIAALCVLFVWLRYKNNGKEGTYNLKENSKTTLTDKQDIFLTKSVSVTTISESSGGSSGGGGHSSGGGGSHGGGGRSF